MDAAWKNKAEEFKRWLDEFLDGINADVISSADNFTKPYELTEEQKTQIEQRLETTTDETIVATVKETNELAGEELESGVREETIDTAKTVTKWFVGAAVARYILRLHGSQVARQVEEKAEAAAQAIETGKAELKGVVDSEFSTTYSQAVKEHQTNNGINNFRWIHSGSENPRLDHLSADGQVYSWEDGAPVEGGLPGVAYNCACVAQPVKERNKMKKYFNFKQNDIYITGVIGERDFFDDTGVVFSEFKKEMEKRKGQSVNIRINSEGGHVFDGIQIYNYLKDFDGEVSVYVEGIAASIASIIMLGAPAERRYVKQGAMAMIHNPWACLCGESKDLLKEAQNLEKVADDLAHIYADRTSLTFEQAKEIMINETYFNADELVKYGFANLADGTAKASKKKILDFVAQMKSCAVEFNSTAPTGVKLNAIENGKTKMTTEIENRLSALETSVADLTKQKEKLEAQNQVLENANLELKAENEKLSSKLEGAYDEAYAKAKQDIEIFAKAKKEADEAGFEVEASNHVELMRGVLASAKVTNTEKFDGESLASMFDYVIKNHVKRAGDELNNIGIKEQPKNLTVFQKIAGVK